jgi:CRISPR/Cas system CMR-associated protein Cmr5 small subunit
MLRYYAYGIENCVGRTLADIHIPSQGIDDNSKVSFSAEEYLESINNHTHPAFDPSAKNEAERRERIRTKIINDAIDYAEQTNDEVRI